MVTLDQVLAKVATAEGDTIASVDHCVRATIDALGFVIGKRTSDVYNPSEGKTTYRVPLDHVLAKVAAAEGDTIESVDHCVRATIAAIGLEIEHGAPYVYNPAEGAYRPAPTRAVPRDQRFASRRRGR